MPLHFSFEGCKPGPNGENVYDMPGDPGHWHPIAVAINMLSMNLGIGRITEKNYMEMGRRVMIYQIINGPYLAYGDGKGGTKEFYITTEDIKLFIGYGNNVSQMTPAEFDKQVIRVLGLNLLEKQAAQGKAAYELVNEHLANLKETTK